VLAGTRDNEDAAVLVFPPGMALIQTLDFFTPIVNDPYRFGQIAAANALSDVYAMGGTPYSAMNIVCFPIKAMDKAILKDILRGGQDKVREAGAVIVGGHSVEDDEIKYGLSVAGYVEPDRFAANRNLRPGDELILTKPLGTGILATAVKAEWEGAGAIEDDLYRWASRLNRAGAEVIRALGLRAATDITGFGLGGHALEMARASSVAVELRLAEIPVIPRALELAGMGLVPAGSHANRTHCAGVVSIAPDADPLRIDLVFDAQTSGGLLLAVPRDKLARARDLLLAAGDLAAHVGTVLPAPQDSGQGPLLRLV
jgi:selenide,water dikinase